MSKTIYNKLVRDNIPKIIAKSGAKANFRILSKDEFRKELKNKLVEETTELLNAKTKEEVIEEIADIEEVLDFFRGVFGIGFGDVENKQYEKYCSKGGFRDRVFLESVEEQGDA